MEIPYQDILLRDSKLEDIDDEIRWMNVETRWMQADTPWETFEPVDPEALRADMTDMIETMPPEGLRNRLEIEAEGKHIGFVCAYPLGTDYEPLNFDEITEDTETVCCLGIEICEPDFWGRGVGTKALAAFLDYYREKGVHPFTLETWSGNRPMLRCAQKLGFREVKREVGVRKVDGKLYDALVLKLDA